jgi:predicted esterase
MPEHETFDEIIQKAQEYFNDEATLQNAYDLMTEAAPRFPEQSWLIYNYRFCAAALMNQTDLALQIIQESLDAGFFWSAAYLNSDEDLKSLRDLPEFKQIIEIGEERYQVAQKNSKPLALPLPLPEEVDGSMPLLLALHGNNSNAQRSVEYWESAVQDGWRTVLLQSSQIIYPEAYIWDDFELGAKEIKAHYDELIASDSPKTGPTIIGGFSKGGEMSIWMALKEIISLVGFIAVNPGGPYISEVDKFLPLIETCKSLTKMRGLLIAGEKDLNLNNIKSLHELLTTHGMDCQLIVAPDIAHDFPADFDQILAQAGPSTWTNKEPSHPISA